MSQLPYIGGFNELADVQAANEHTINLMPEKTDGKQTWRLTTTPGLKPFCNTGTGKPARGAIEALNRAFVVSGDKLCELFANGTFIVRGALSSSIGNVSIGHNGIHVVLTDGASGYTLKLSDNTFGTITDPDWYPSSSLAVVDGYAVFIRDGTEQFYHSDLYNATVYLGLDFESAYSNPDLNSAVANDSTGLLVFGTQSVETYFNSGKADLVWQRRQGYKISYGCLAAATVVEIDNGVNFLGRDPDGTAGVFRLSGGQPKLVSNLALEKILRLNQASLSTAVAWSYRQDGHAFYCLDIPGVASTYVYDLATGFWHERRSFDINGIWGKWRARYHVAAFGKNIVGSATDGKFYTVEPEEYFEDTTYLIRRERVLKPVYDDGDFERTIFYSLTFDIPTGIGLVDPPYDDPVMAMQISDDGGVSFGSEKYRRLGKIGETTTKIQYRRLAMSRNRVFKVSYAFPTPFSILGAYIDGSR